MKFLLGELKCLFGRHEWFYTIHNKHRRECRRCGKIQDATYDMMYGTTQWEDSDE